MQEDTHGQARGTLPFGLIRGHIELLTVNMIEL